MTRLAILAAATAAAHAPRLSLAFHARGRFVDALKAAKEQEAAAALYRRLGAIRAAVVAESHAEELAGVALKAAAAMGAAVANAADSAARRALVAKR